MSPNPIRLALSLAAAGALALPAVASAAPVPVEAGHVQHTVWETSVSGTKATKSHPHRKRELWLGRSAGRNVIRDADTGKVLDECVSSASSTRCWDAAANRLDVYPRSLSLLGYSWETEAANNRSVIASGAYVFSADTTFQDKPAKIYKATRQSAADDNDLDTMIVEPETLFPLQYESVDPQGADVLHSTQTVVLRETLSQSSVSLAMRKHPKAKVVDHRKKHHKPKRKTPHY
jgi:opacity protein-like surface antigen